MSRNCGRCHTCGAKLQSVQDGEEWCPSCSAYRRYPSHGWAYSRTADRDTQCPTWLGREAMDVLDAGLKWLNTRSAENDRALASALQRFVMALGREKYDERVSLSGERDSE